MPVGPYKEFGDCVRAQRNKGYSKNSARRICGQIEKNTTTAARSKPNIDPETGQPYFYGSFNNVKYEEDNKFYIKAFMMDASENINKWGVHPSSIPKRISSAYGKPLVLTQNFDHPMPPDFDRVGGLDDGFSKRLYKQSDSELYDDDNDPHNIVKVDDIVDHWKAYQESYRIGNIIDVTEKHGIYYAIIEVTDPAAVEAFRNNDLPLFVSPAIAQLDPLEDPANISNWEFIHLAIVSNPAYTIKKALVTGQCHENVSNHNESGKCLLQLRQAAVITTNKDNGQKTLNGCGFCRTKALARYASLVNQQYPQERSVKANSSFDFLQTQLNEQLLMSSEQQEQQNNNNTNNNNNNEEVTNTTTQQEKTKETKFDQVVKETNPSPNPNKGKNIDPNTGQPYPGSTEKVAEEVGIKVAGMEECVQIFTQNGVNPEQSVQICKLAAKALMENQNQQQPPGSTGRDRPSPGISGQFGSTSTVADYEKEIAKQEIKIGQLTEELRNYKKGDKTDAQRIAELEETVTKLNSNLKEKELEAYLVTKIADTEQRNKKIKRFAELNMTIDDLKEIYDDKAETDPKPVAVKKTASVVGQQQETSPISRVKLQVASTNNNDSQVTNEIKERNNRISSLLLKRGLE